MSKYEDQSNSEYAICPYCESENLVEAEDYDEDDHKEKCFSCGKFFYLYQYHITTHNTAPSCNLNNKDHEYPENWAQSASGNYYKACDVCGALVFDHSNKEVKL